MVSDDPRVVLVNTPTDHAEKIARELVEKKLAACVNVVPGVRSFYFWEGKLVADDESTLLVKTRASLLPELTEAVRAVHPYRVPEVLSLVVDGGAGNPDYIAWIRSETK